MAQPIVAPPENPTIESGLRALALKLADDSEAARLPARDLAQQFSVPEDLIGDLLATLRGPEDGPSLRMNRWRSFAVASMRWTARVREWAARAFAKPIQFAIVTGLLGIGLAILVNDFVPQTRLGWATDAIVAIIAATTLGAHLVLYWRHGMARFPLYGSIAFFAVTSPMLLVAVLSQPLPAPVALDRGAIVGLVVATSFMISGIYGLAGLVASLLGGYTMVQAQERSERNRTRQDMLERLFELHEKLRSFAANPRLMKRRRVFHPLRTAAYFPLVAFGIGLLLGLFQIGTIGSVEQFVLGPARTPVLAAVSLAVQLVTLACFLGIGFLSGRTRRSLIAIFFALGGSMLPQLIPFGGFGVARVAAQVRPDRIVTIVGFYGALGVLAALAASIEERAAKQRRLNLEDPVALMAEIIHLQRRLAPRNQAVCVMVVDVAQSTRMKANADPLVVEWSFREFQKLVERLVGRHGGEVLSTAGDGAVASFSGSSDALASAKAIQTEIVHFNSRTNRLESPFRVRLGLHCGNVHGQLTEVQFNELIDIAAHVESTAPVGGIAVTQAVADDLEHEKLAAMVEPVDGHPIYVVLEPTQGA